MAQSEKGYEYGVWTNYTPLAQIQKIGPIANIESNCSHIHQLKYQENDILIYYICFFYENLTIQHVASLIQTDSTLHTHYLNIDTTKYNYQGKWIYFHFTSLPSQNFIKLIFTTQDGAISSLKQINYILPLEYNQLKLIFGNSYQVENQLFKAPQKLTYYRGKIFVYNLRKNLLIQNLQPLQSLDYLHQTIVQAQNLYYNSSRYLSPKCYERSVYFDDGFYDEVKTIQLDYLFSLDYRIQGWLKISEGKIFENINYDVFQMEPMNIAGYEQFIAATKLKISYQIKDTKQFIVLQTYSYQFPILNINQQSIDNMIIKQYIEVNQFNYYYWHMFYLYYDTTNKKLSFKIYQNSVSQYSNDYFVNQFVIFEPKFSVALNFKQYQLKLEIADFRQVYCPNNKQFNISCFDSCLTCSGPTQYDCDSCDESLNRQYDVKNKMCVCKLGYYDYDGNECQYDSNFSAQLIEQQDTQYSSYKGYSQFEYQGEFFNCPEVINEFILSCSACLLDKEYWLNNFDCKNSIYPYKNDEDSVFQRGYTNEYYYSYIFQQQELIICEYCLKCLQTYPEFLCSYSQYYQHLGQASKIICISNYIVFNGICVKAVNIEYNYKDYNCGQYCEICSNEQCQSCVDPILYFKSILYPHDCFPCYIENCKYCFEYVYFDHSINSLVGNSHNYEDDVMIGCALCYPGFTFNFSNRQCEYVSLDSECQQGIILESGEFYCLISTQSYSQSIQAIQFSKCSQYIDYCSQCIFINSKPSCVVCQPGYIAKTNLGQCVLCTAQNSYECVENSTGFDDYWMNEFQALYFYLSDSKNIYIRAAYTNYYVTSCINDSVLINGVCVQNCLLTNSYCSECKHNVCINCITDRYATQIRTPECVICPYYCTYCIQNQDSNINPYYVSESFTQYDCYSQRRSTAKYQYIDNKFRRVQICNIYEKCYYQVIQDFEIASNNLIFYYGYISKKYQNLTPKGDFLFDLNSVKEWHIINTFQEDIVAEYPTFLINWGVRLQQFVYTLELSKVTFQSSQNNTFSVPDFFSDIVINYFDEIAFTNIKFTLSTLFRHQFSNEQISLFYSNIQFIISDNLISEFMQFQVLIETPKYLSLYNITFQNLYFKSTSLFQNLDFDHSSIPLMIQLKHVTFVNCTFQDSFILYFQNNNQIDIQMDSLIFENCLFINSSLLYQQSLSGMLKMQSIQLINCEFSNLTFINSNAGIYMNNIILQNIKSEDSTFAIITNSCQILNIIIQESKFTLLEMWQLRLHANTNEINLQFQNITTQNSQFNEYQFLDVYMTNQSSVIVILQDFKLMDCEISNFNRYLYSIKNYEYEAQLNGNNIKVIIDNFSIRKKEHQKSLAFWNDCINLNSSNYFSLTGIRTLQIQNSHFLNLAFVNHKLFNIQLSQLNLDLQISIFNVTMADNLLIKTKTSDICLLQFGLQSEQQIQCRVQMNQIAFTRNVINYYQNDFYQSLGTLLIGQMPQGEVVLDQVLIDSNLITNTTSTFFYINSQSLQINELKSINNNDIKNIWFFLAFPEGMSQPKYIVEELVFQQFQIKTSSGVAIIQAETIQIYNSSFMNGVSQQNNIIYIIGKQSCTIKLQNIVIFNQTNNLIVNDDSIDKFYGCFYIDASNGQLDLLLLDLVITSIANIKESAFMVIKSSLLSNKINITNCYVENIFSFHKTLFDFSLSLLEQSMNEVTISNLKITNSQQFVNSIVSNFLLSKSNFDLLLYGLIYITNSQVSLQNVTISGFYAQPLLQLIDCSKIKIQNSNIMNIITQQSLMIIEASNTLISFHSITFSNIKQIEPSNLSISEEFNVKKLYSFVNIDCALQIRDSLEQTYDYNKNLNKFAVNEFIALNSRTIEGFIQLNLQNCNLQISNALFSNISCFQCSKGAIYIQMEDENKFFLQHSQFLHNTFQYYGNIALLNQSIVKSNILKVENCDFDNTKCEKGCGIYLQSCNASIKQSNFQNNIASAAGGGIYSEGEIEFNKVQFINNSAQMGSSLYLLNSQLQQRHLNEITISDYEQRNQIKEFPSSLQIKYNNMLLKQIDYQNSTLNITMVDYNEQTSNRRLQYIVIPSGQKLSEYRLFNQYTLSYLSQESNIELIAYNKIQEKQQYLTDSYCTIKGDILNQTNNEFKDEYQGELVLLYFNNLTNSYNMENYSIIFDPYNELQILQLRFVCNSIKNQNYVYLLNVKTFYCQMGEYYQDGGCYQCDYEKGFYSVQSNQTICQKIDTNKIIQNTANRLQLKQGYWRALATSPIIDQCVNNLENCQGGWDVGTKSCMKGHIGALCEQCDINNEGGNGQFIQSSPYICRICDENWQSIIPLVLLGVWVIVSGWITVQSVVEVNKSYKRLYLTSVHYRILHKYNQNLGSGLIKLLTNHLLILSAVIGFSNGINIRLQWLSLISSPTLSSSFSFDCWIAKYDINIDLIYLRIFLIQISPIFFINLILWIQLLYYIIKRNQYDASILSITTIYIYVVSYSGIIEYFGSLVSNRSISGINWVSANVSYRYETQKHQNWIYYCIIPLLICWCAIIPLFLAIKLKTIKNILFQLRVRRYWSYIYNEYRLQTYYWEIVRIIQREFQLLILTLYQQEIIIIFQLFLLIQVGYLTIIHKLNPYNHSYLNKLEFQSVQKTIFILLFGTIAHISYLQDIIMINTISTALLVLCIIYHFLPFVNKLSQTYLIQIQSFIDTKLFDLASSNSIFSQRLNRLLNNKIQKEERKRILKMRFIKLTNYLRLQSKYSELANTQRQRVSNNTTFINKMSSNISRIEMRQLLDGMP